MHPHTARSIILSGPASMAVVVALISGCTAPDPTAEPDESPVATSTLGNAGTVAAAPTGGPSEAQSPTTRPEPEPSEVRQPTETPTSEPDATSEPGPPTPTPTPSPTISTPSESESPTEASNTPETSDPDDLNESERMVFGLLNSARADADAPPLLLDADLTASSKETACAIARGEEPLVSDPERMREAGADHEHLGLTVEEEPDVAAQAMHDWWMQSEERRAERLNPEYVRYGIGACRDEDHTYYTERFAVGS